MSNSTYRRRIGDRREGRLLRTLSPANRLAPYIQKTAGESSGFYSGSIDISAVDSYIATKRDEGYGGMSMLHLFIASYVRMLAFRPGLNRFVAGSKIYARHSIDVVISLKRSASPEIPVSIIKTELEPTDTIYDVYRKINVSVEAIMADDGFGGAEGLSTALLRFPGLILKFILWLFRIGEYFGSLPASIRESSPYHGSLTISDLGPLEINPAYKCLSSFGNLPISITLGEKYSDKSGKRFVDFSAVVDERICDAYYYASAFKYLQHYMKNPQLLELRPEKVEEDIF